MDQRTLARWRRRRRHETALHEGGHAVLLYLHWRRLPVERRERPPFWSVDVYRDGPRGGMVGLVTPEIEFSARLSLWAKLQIDLAGYLAEEGAATRKALHKALQGGEWWDLEPYGPDDDEGSDYGKIRDFLDRTGCPDKVLQVAVQETATILWEHRRLVHEVARRAEKAEFLFARDLVDVMPELAPAVAAWEAQCAELRAHNERAAAK